MDHIDSKYVSLLSAKLQKFKRVKANLYNFRCPICGDSQKNKNKARGYLYSVKNNTNFKCHNCGASLSLNNFLKKLDIVLWKNYCLDKFKEGHAGGRNFVTDEPKFVFEKPKFTQKIVLPLCSEVEIARTYLQNRKIDPTKFYFAENFDEFVRTFKGVDYGYMGKEPRIIIPLYFKKDLIGFQGRSLNSKSIKYITVMLREDVPKIYGIDKIKNDNKVYITEGPFDSTFIRNSIAMCGADADVRSWGISNPVWVYDNEPRNKEILNRISRTIDSGDSIVIWPTNIKEKDINDMLLAGHDVQNLVESNTYSGLEAKLKFTTWKKV
jgi:transcription elongation factor Elf1